MLPTWSSMDISLRFSHQEKKCHQLIRDHLNSGTVCVRKVLHKTGFIHLLRFFSVS